MTEYGCVRDYELEAEKIICTRDLEYVNSGADECVTVKENNKAFNR